MFNFDCRVQYFTSVSGPQHGGGGPQYRGLNETRLKATTGVLQEGYQLTSQPIRFAEEEEEEEEGGCGSETGEEGMGDTRDNLESVVIYVTMALLSCRFKAEPCWWLRVEQFCSLVGTHTWRINQ